MKALIWTFLVFYLNIYKVDSLGVVTTTSLTFEVKVSDSVTLPCDVLNEGVNDTVIWDFIDHNVTISTGTDIRIKDLGYLSKYEITSQVSSTTTEWRLSINNIQFDDQGSYRCQISGPDSNPQNTRVVHHIEVQGAADKPSAPNANVMSCCQAKGLDPCIYPLCDRANANLVDFINVLNNDSCVDNNLIQVLECGQGGRNVLGCCIRSGITGVCERLCEGWGSSDGTSYRSCIGAPALAIATCYDEGLEYLPGQPTSVSAVSASTGFLASWQPPLDNADEVTKYRVRYRLKNTTHYNTVSTQGRQTMLPVLGLAENRIYEFQVIAVAGSGASRPSYTVDIAVKGDVPQENITQTVYDCCVSKNIRAECLGFCSADTFLRGGHPVAYTSCYDELEDMYKCLAYQGNHTACCRRLNVPNECVPLCEGKVNVNKNDTFCFVHQSLIASCILEGSGLLPSPPYNTRVVPGSITSDSVTIEWENPADFEEGDHYVIAWRYQTTYDSAEWNTISEFVGNTYTITGLDPAEIYDVVVATENEVGSSLPELTLVVVTEGVNFNYQPPYNETACCVEKGVTGQCLQLCSHTFRLTPESVGLVLLSCNESVTPMLQCATDGRDHTDCCIREGLPDNCLGLCSLRPDEVPSESFIPCAPYKNQLSTCFNEGKEVLPYPPVQLTIKGINTHSITVDWQPPTGPNVTSYMTQYKTMEEEWSQMQSKDSQESFVTIEGLKPDTQYYFRVFSKNDNGTSLPSELVVGYTLPIPVQSNTTFDWDEVYQNRSDCCNNKGISTECIAGCINGDVLDPTKCLQDFPKIFACAADGRDHVSCCRRLPDFPAVCEPFCSGQIPDDTTTTSICITYSSDLYTCFLEGQGYLPSPPQQLRVQSYSHNQIVIQWDKPSSNCDTNCVYEVLIWQDQNDVKKYTVQDSTSFSFTELKPQTEYYLSVLARKNGTSLPSPYIIVRTRVNPNNGLVVNQSPGNIINMGQPVSLECTAYGRFTSLNWIRNQQSVINNNVYSIASVTKEDEGIYFCNATFENDANNSKQLFLNVRYAPHAIGITEKSVLPGLNQEARITCTFKGFPDRVTWFKEGVQLSNGDKYLIDSIQPDLTDGTAIAVLRIKDVTKEDFGTYKCTGLNDYGNDTITGQLDRFPDSVTWFKEGVQLLNRDKYLIDSIQPDLTDGTAIAVLRIKNVTKEDFGMYKCTGLNSYGNDTITGHLDNLVPSVPIPPHENITLRECCNRRNVSELCAVDICKYPLDLSEIIYDTKYLSCLLYFQDFIACGTDGKDHSQCCKSKGVREQCLDFCAGALPQFTDSWDLLPCVSHVDDIGTCVTEGQNNIPTAPRNLRVQLLYDQISVTWDIPEQNADKLKKYDIYYQPGDSQPVIESVSKSKTQFYLPEANRDFTYTVWGKAVNNFGQSAATPKQTITVNKLTPRSPRNIVAEIVSEININIQWAAPAESLVRITGYKVIYWQTNRGKGTAVSAEAGNVVRTRLTDLQPNTIYSIVVVGRSSDGYGEESEEKNVATGRVPETATLGPRVDDNQGKVGLALGLVFGVLFLIAVAFVVVMFYRKKFHGKPLSTRTESVAFENPQYSNSRRSGLPEENPGGDQFGYSNLREENDLEQIHLSFDNPTTKVSGDNPATLDITA